MYRLRKLNQMKQIDVLERMGILHTTFRAMVICAVTAAALQAESHIVMSSGVGVYAGEKLLHKLQPGTVIESTQAKGDWFLVPRHGGWVHRTQVVELKTALAALERGLTQQPTAVDHHFRGIVLSELGRHGDAMLAFDAALRMGLSEASVFVNRGNARQRAGDYAKAIAEFTHAIKLDPTSAAAFNNRASARVELRQIDLALADAQEAIRLDPKYAEAYNNKGVVHRIRGEADEALAAYTKCIEVAPWYTNAYANRGYMQKRLKNYTAALTDYRLAIKVNPRFAGALNDLAWLRATCPDESIRDAGEAVELARKACELTSNENVECLDTLAAALAADGQFQEAVEVQTRAIAQMEPEAADAAQKRLLLYRNGEAFREAN